MASEIHSSLYFKLRARRRWVVDLNIAILSRERPSRIYSVEKWWRAEFKLCPGFILAKLLPVHLDYLTNFVYIYRLVLMKCNRNLYGTFLMNCEYWINWYYFTGVNTSRLCTHMPFGEHRLVGHTLQPPNTSAVDAKDAAILRSLGPISAVSGVWEPISWHLNCKYYAIVNIVQLLTGQSVKIRDNRPYNTNNCPIPVSVPHLSDLFIRIYKCL